MISSRAQGCCWRDEGRIISTSCSKAVNEGELARKLPFSFTNSFFLWNSHSPPIRAPGKRRQYLTCPACLKLIAGQCLAPHVYQLCRQLAPNRPCPSCQTDMGLQFCPKVAMNGNSTKYCYLYFFHKQMS